MVTLPLVWLIGVLTIIAAYALAQNARLPASARFFLCSFLLSLAMISLLLGLRLSFDAAWAARVQPLVAVVIAPLAYLGLCALTRDVAPTSRQILLWNGLPIVLVQLVILADIPISADVLVLLINCVYLVRIAGLLRFDADDYAHVAPDKAGVVRTAIYATICLLGMMVATDILIVAALLFSGEAFFLTLLTGASGVFTAFIFVVALVGVPMVLRSPNPVANRAEVVTEQDRSLLTRLDSLMNDKQLYKDSNLTLARVARRLSVPARDVSGAINRTTGENFSRYINGFRIRHAQGALQDTALPITGVMLDAGFVSKSSFNTEFRRIVGQTPSQFRAGRAQSKSARP